ncbi:hypothetical protein OHB04_02255 [Streptomyces sp. NBC_01775]|uniref:hypothetical protein n=1 Tax=Streptomyces sp. NBC_01775 TaxID=2975939 RepID=UPI002DD9D4D4|nr:hypothetical protein [Streptomyces sp. NBC_01775]WSB74715.1 hypothetical protein OHB04_02255 [Streptomyces sp. NBC_01775]
MTVWAAVVSVIGTVGTILGGIFVARATVRAASATAAAQSAAALAAAEPAKRTADLSVLQATVERVDVENGQLRARQSRLEAVLRAFSWTVDELYRWARSPQGSPPEPHDLVKDYNRTGV